MKRILSLVLVLALVLGTIPAGFAATATAGETLKGYGLLAGDQNGNLNEGNTINRAEMMVVYAQLLGKKTEAAAYSIPSTSKDVKAGTWYAPYVAFAEKEAWTAGIGNGMFDPMGKVTVQQAAAFMLKALGYTVTDFSTVVADATAKGLLKDVTAAANTPIVRGSLFTVALNTLNTPVKDSTVSLGTKLGVMKPVVSALDSKAAVAISHNTIQVTFNVAPTAVVAADFSVVDKDAKALEVKAATLISAKTAWITTADQTAGKIYTVKVAGKSFPVTGLQKDASLPELDKSASKVLDNNTVKLVFTKKLDPRNALVAANYTFTNGLTASAVEYAKDKDGVDVRTTLYVTTSTQETNKLYKVTVSANVTDLYSNKVQTEDDKNFFNFVGIKVDTTSPKIKSVIAENGKKVIVEFDDKSDMDKTATVNPANYVFVNKTDATKTLTATSVKFKTSTAYDTKLIVEVTTSEQVEKNSYELTINNGADKFGNLLLDTKRSFAGAPLDKTAPKIEGIQAVSNTMIRVTFTEAVETATAEVAANYTVDKDLAVTKAVVDSEKDTVLWITTSSQKSGTTYKMSINNVTDEYGNAMASATQYFVGAAEDTSKPSVVNAYAYVASGNTYVRVKFAPEVKEATAKVASNYNFGTEIGYGISVTKITDAEYDVKVNALSDGKLYTVTVSNVESLAGIGMDYEHNEKQFIGKVSSDTAAPKLVTAVTMDKNTVKLIFDKTMTKSTLQDIANYTFKKSGSAYAIAGSIYNTGDTTVYEGISVASDVKSVTLRFTGDVFNDFDNKSTTFNVALNTTVKGLNNASVDTSYNNKDFYSTTIASKEVKISSVTPLDEFTVDVKFNQDIEFATTAPVLAAIKFYKDGVYATNAAKATIISADTTVLRVATTAKLDAGVKYTVKFETVSAPAVTDAFKQLPLAVDSSDYFYGSSNTYVKPNYITYTMGTLPGSIVITMNKELASADMSKMKLNNSNGAELTGTLVSAKVDGDDYTKVNVFFNNTGLEVGKTYELVLAKDAVTDLSLQTNDEIKLPFGVTSTTRDAVKIDGVSIAQTMNASGVAQFDTLTIVFNKAVNNISNDNFVIYTSVAGLSATATTWGTALNNNGTTYQVLSTKAGAISTDPADFYSMVTIKLTTPVTSLQSVRIELAGSDLRAKDDAQKETTVVPVAVPVK